MINGINNRLYLVCCVDCSYIYTETKTDMTKKESFLKSILDQISMLQKAYDYNNALPDYIFENLQPIGLPSHISGSTDEPIKVKEEGGGLEYGENKRLILKILAENGKAMLKSQIVHKFLDEVVMPEKMALNAVTNALSSLTIDKEIKGYKPAGLKFKGLFWTLSEWWITDLKSDKERLPMQYEPYSGKIKQF